MSQEASGNSYLELRKEKIARNEKVLASLGLSKTAGKSPKQETKVREVESKNGDVNVAIVHTRRSSRLKSSSAPQVLYSPIKKDGLLDTVIPKTTSKRKRVDKSSRHIVKAETVQRIDAKPGTTRATFIDVQRVLCGNFDYPVFIGQRLSNTGKKAVIDHASLMCGNAPDISFNKYSGVCEFLNEAICLWVNIGDPKAELQNQFLDGGEKITWFGGSRMHEGSPAIQQLISIGKSASAGNLPESSGIVLWVRLANLKGGFEPYTCLGRLGYHSHEPFGSPVKFTWNLLDFEFLKKTSGLNKGESYFQRIVSRTC